MAEASITISGLGGLDKDLSRLNAVIRSPRPILNQIGGVMKRQIADTFRLGRDPITNLPWRPTSAFTLGSRPGGGAGGKTLQDTARLFTSLVSARPVVDTNSVSITTNVRYARVQNDGGTITPVKAKALALPITREARRAGGAGRWWNANKAKRPFILTTKSGTAFIVTAEVKGRGRNAQRVLTFHFILKDSVNIPQRRFLGYGTQQKDEIVAFVFERLFDEMQRAQREVGE